MGLSALRSVSDAIDATRSFLLAGWPRRWAALALAVAFMGSPGTPAPASPQLLDPTIWSGPGPEVPEPPDGEPAALPFELLDPATWPGWLYALVLGVVGLWLAYQAVGVLMRFVVVESLARGEVRLRRDAAAHLGDALRVVGFRLALAALAVPALLALVVVVAPVGPVTLDGALAGAAGVVASAVALALWVVDAATLQFVVPTVVATGTGVLAGWRRFWRTLVGEWREYAAFVVVRTALGVGVGIAATVALLAALALGGLVAVTIGAATVAAAGGLGAIGAVSGGVLAVLALGFLAYAVLAAALVAVPFQVYLWTYALLVLGDTDADLDLVGDLRTAARSGDLV